MKKITYKIGTGLLLSLSSCLATAQSRIELQKDLSMLMPPGFVPLTEVEINEYYTQTNPPLAVYTYEEQARTQWVFRLKPSPWHKKDTMLMQQFLRANIEALYEGEITWLQNELRQINEHPAAYVAFMSPQKSHPNALYAHSAERNYHVLLNLMLSPAQLLVHFSCPAKESARWEPIVAEAIASLSTP